LKIKWTTGAYGTSRISLWRNSKDERRINNEQHIQRTRKRTTQTDWWWD
jgi:hypothetical protein